MGEISDIHTPSAGIALRGRRCLVLTKPEQPVYPQLLQQLGQRGVQTFVLHDEPAVMTALALDQASILIVHEPALWPDGNELRQAVLRYYPKTVCWQFNSSDQSAPPGLTRWQDVNPQPAMNPFATASDPQAPLLTREEMDMLLGSTSHKNTDDDDDDGL